LVRGEMFLHLDNRVLCIVPSAIAVNGWHDIIGRLN
jgi:hypothetical protein